MTFGAQMSSPQVDVDMVQTLQAKNPMAVAFAKTHKPMSDTDPEGWSPVDAAPTVTHWPRDRSDTGTDVAVVQPICTDMRGHGDGLTAPTLRAKETANDFAPMVAQPVAFDSYNLCETGDITQTIKSPQGGVTETVGAVMTAMQVRRLTPVECERLQGFPDGYTNIPWRKKPESPDGPRYKALGNSMAVPVMNWIGQRIQKVSEL